MKNKVFTMLMLVVMLAQLLGPTVYNVNLVASEFDSESLSEVSSEQVIENETSQSEENSSESLSESSESESTDSSEVISESETIIDSSQDSQLEEIIEESSELDSSQNVEINTRVGDSSITEVEMTPEEVYSGDSITNRVEVSINPTDTGSILNEGENWDTFTITLAPEFDFNQTFGIEITQGDPNIITGYDVIELEDGSTQIVFELDQEAILSGGQTIGIIFVSSIENGNDLSDYGIDVEMCGDQGTCFNDDASVLYHDPATFEISKEMIDPAFAAAGEELTYEITMVAEGTGAITISPYPQIIDQLPANVEYVSSTPAGVYDGTSVTWDWTDEDIANRYKTVQVTIIADPDSYENGDTITNTASAIYEGEEAAETEDNHDIYPGFFIELPDGGVSKNGAPTTNPDGSTTAPGDTIFWHFDNINYQGRGTLTDYTITDTFPVAEDGSDILFVDKVCYGAVKEAPNAFVDATINYIDGSSAVLTASMDTDGDNCISIPDEADVATSGVESIVWNYGEVNLPFKITGAGVSTIVNPEADPETEITNNLDADFNIPIGDGGEGEWDICPPPFISYDNGDGTVECRDEVTDNIGVSDDEVYGIFTKEIIDSSSPLEELSYGDTVNYRLTISNADASPSSLFVDGVYDQLPDGIEYVDGTAEISSGIPDTPVEAYDKSSNILSFTFSDDETPLEVTPGSIYYIDFQAKITSKNVEQLTNNAYLVSSTPELLLPGTGTTSTTEPTDFDGDGELETVYNDSADVTVNRAKVNVEKEITNDSKVFVPSNVDAGDGQSTINYSFTIENVDTKLIGTNNAPLIDPQVVDSIPKQVILDQSSLSFDYSDAPNMVAGSETVTVTGDSTSSPIDGEGQDLAIDFTGTLNPGDSITVTYSADIKDYAIAAQVENTVSLKVKDGEEDFYTEDSVFSSEAIGIIDQIAAQKITKTASSEIAEPGQSIEYVVEVTNEGTMPLKDVTFIDDVPHDGTDGSTVNAILSQLPHVYYIPQGGEPVEREIEFKITYKTFLGLELTATLTNDELEQFIVENDVENIVKLEAVIPDTLYPGDMAQLVFNVETPTSGDSAAVPGDELHNTAFFNSTAVEMDGSDGKVLENGSNEVITTIVDRIPGTYALGDFVYFDLDNDGAYNPDFDRPASGATMVLTDSDGNEVASTTVDEDGYYKFSGLVPGEYTVEKQSGYFDKWYQVYPQGATEQSLSKTTTLVDSDDLDVDFRIVPASIIGTIFYDGYDADTTDDSYYNGIYDYTDGSENELVTYDTAVEETEVNLYDENNILLDTAVTDDGMFAFYDLKAGTYTVETTPMITATDGQEYLLTAESETQTFTLERGEVKTGVDFGYIEPVEVEGTVWYDANVNDIFDTEENTSSTYDQNRDLKVDLLDIDGNVIESTTT